MKPQKVSPRSPFFTPSDIPNRKIATGSSRQISLPSFISTGSIGFGSPTGEFVSGKSYKAWVFLWNQLPSDPGYWEAYADKAELLPSSHAADFSRQFAKLFQPRTAEQRG